MLRPPARKSWRARCWLRGSFPAAGSLAFSPVLRLRSTCRGSGSRECQAGPILPECRCGLRVTRLPARCDLDRSASQSVLAIETSVSPRKFAGSPCDAFRCWRQLFECDRGACGVPCRSLCLPLLSSDSAFAALLQLLPELPSRVVHRQGQSLNPVRQECGGSHSDLDLLRG